MICYLLMFVVVIILCSSLAPHSGLRDSAVRALESSVNMVGRFSPLNDQEDDIPERKAVWEPPPRAEVRPNNSASPSKHGPGATWKTALYRKRPTPLMQKRVAVRYAFKCGICKLPLDETWETDHIVPLAKAKSFEDAERLNAIDNLQAVHRACHQIKTSREAR
jgi:5-methylcytosine-specific restriction endonuclease McrA